MHKYGNRTLDLSFINRANKLYGRKQHTHTTVRGNSPDQLRVIDRTDLENLALYKMLEAFCNTSGILVYFTYLRYAESDKGGYQNEKLDLDH
jgi:hypothetical protein